MAGLRSLVLRLIISSVALHMTKPIAADNVRQSDASTAAVIPMTYDSWVKFCDETIKITTEKEANGDIVNATINTPENSHIIVDVFGDFKAEYQMFQFECDRLRKLREVVLPTPDADPTEAKKMLDSHANILGRSILMICMVRKCEEPGYNYHGAVNYLKNRLMTSFSDDFSHIRSLVAIMAPLLFTLLC